MIMAAENGKPPAVPWPRDYADPKREPVPPLSDDEIRTMREVVETIKFRRRILKRLAALLGLIATLIPSAFAVIEFLRDRAGQ
jgi:hypothetical protein